MRIFIYDTGLSNKALIEYFKRNNIDYDTEDGNALYDYVIKPPGMKLGEVNVRGRVVTDIEYLYEQFRPLIVGITGSNGKTTTTLMINEILSKKYKCEPCCNIGIPLADVIERDAIFIAELSSFELEGAPNIKPRVSVLLNVNPCHLDHHFSFDDYKNSKFNITKNQDYDDFLIYNLDDSNIREMVLKTKAISYSFSLVNKKANAYYNGVYIKVFGTKYKPHSHELFNIQNEMAAILVGEIFGVRKSRINKALDNFIKPKYRLERLTDNIYNDSKSTNPYSTLEAVINISDACLIAGGYDRMNDLEIFKEIAKHTKKILLVGASKNRLYKYLNENNIESTICDSIEDAVKMALKLPYKILYSPAFPSFDKFKDYIERGKYFEELIKKELKAL